MLPARGIPDCKCDDPMRGRAESLRGVALNEFDVCVIGGGATGAGCALDAQLRGLRTVLLEGGDFASGASSASTKLVHGGVRYLEQAVKSLNLEEYRMVRRALKERVYMLRNAPHLAHASEFLVPVYSWTQAFYYRAGMKMYDVLAGKQNLFPSRFLSREAALDRMPRLRRDRLRGAIVYSDGQFDDARYNLALVKSFRKEGGAALNYTRVLGFSRNGSEKLTVAKVRDQLAGEEFSVKARTFVNATGPASDTIRRLASPGTRNRLRPSKGVHILFPAELSPGQDALLVPKTEDGRVIFAVPWQGRLLVGTTDDDAGPETRMVVLRDEAEYLLRQLNPYLESPLNTGQIVSGLSGLRPLVAARTGDSTKELIRDHEVEIDEQSGLISILGGKWTTHRLMAEDTINAVEKAQGRPSTECKTRQYPLAGAENFTDGHWKSLAREFEVTPDTAKHLTQKFGTCAEDVLAVCQEDSSWKLPLVEGWPAVQAEVVYCAREEMAMTIEDVLARRTGLQLYDWRLAKCAAPSVGSLLAKELNWTADETTAAISAYKEKISGDLRELGLEKA